MRESEGEMEPFWGVAGEGGPDAWHHSLIFPARTELWFLQVRTVAAAEGATPPAVPRRVLSNLRSRGGFKNLKKERKKIFIPAEEPETLLSGPATGTHTFNTNPGIIVCFNDEDVMVYKLSKKKRNSEADKKR